MLYSPCLSCFMYNEVLQQPNCVLSEKSFTRTVRKCGLSKPKGLSTSLFNESALFTMKTSLRTSLSKKTLSLAYGGGNGGNFHESRRKCRGGDEDGDFPEDPNSENTSLGEETKLEQNSDNLSGQSSSLWSKLNAVLLGDSVGQILGKSVATFLLVVALFTGFNETMAEAITASPRKLMPDEEATVRLFQESTPSVVYITNLAVRFVPQTSLSFPYFSSLISFSSPSIPPSIHLRFHLLSSH